MHKNRNWASPSPLKAGDKVHIEFTVVAISTADGVTTLHLDTVERGQQEPVRFVLPTRDVNLLPLYDHTT